MFCERYRYLISYLYLSNIIINDDLIQDPSRMALYHGSPVVKLMYVTTPSIDTAWHHTIGVMKLQLFGKVMNPLM